MRKKITFTKIVLKAVFERTLNVVVHYVTQNFKNYIIEHRMLNNYFQHLANSLKNDISNYLKGKSIIDVLRDSVDFTRASTNIHLLNELFSAGRKFIKREIKKKIEELLRLIEKSNEIFIPYVSLCALYKLRNEPLVIACLTIAPTVFSGPFIVFLQLVGFSLMTGTEASFFYFYPDSYHAMLLDASLQTKSIYCINPDLFYDIDKLSQLQGDLTETFNQNEMSGNADTSVADQPKRKGADYIFLTVCAVGLIFAGGVLCSCKI